MREDLVRQCKKTYHLQKDLREEAADPAICVVSLFLKTQPYCGPGAEVRVTLGALWQKLSDLSCPLITCKFANIFLPLALKTQP